MRGASHLLLGSVLVLPQEARGFVQTSLTGLRRACGNREYGPRKEVFAAHPPTADGSDAIEDGENALLPFHHSSTVYIEMTDMYGIVYHANYVTYAQRAIEHAFGAPGVRIHSLRSMKYRAAATLGDVVACDGSLVACLDEERSRWRFDLTDASDPSRVFVSAEAVISWPGGVALPPGTTVGTLPSAADRTTAVRAESQLLEPLPEEFVDSAKTLDVTVFSDHVDLGGNLSIRALLNYFERIRTLSLGRGADGELGLVRLHREGISVVVTNISDLRVDSKGVEAGDKLEVRLGAKLSRGNRVMTMYETLWTKGGKLVAHAEIALFCMDNDSRRFRPVPPWVQEILMVP